MMLVEIEVYVHKEYFFDTFQCEMMAIETWVTCPFFFFKIEGYGHVIHCINYISKKVILHLYFLWLLQLNFIVRLIALLETSEHIIKNRCEFINFVFKIDIYIYIYLNKVLIFYFILLSTIVKIYLNFLENLL